MEIEKLKLIIEAAILAAGEPVSLERLRDLFDEAERPDKEQMRAALESIHAECELRGIELKEIATGFCFQAKTEFAPWVKRLWAERVPRYSRALWETLALIAYRQPITRAEIEDVRGVVVSSNIIKTLLENEWIQIVGQREVPGRPSLYATTKQFLDHFNLKNLEELPVLMEPQNIEEAAHQLESQSTVQDTTDTSMSEDMPEAENSAEFETEVKIEEAVKLEAEES